MPPFPPVAMKGGIRHDGRSGRRKMERSRLNEDENFLGLLSNGLMQNDDGEKEEVAIQLIGSGKRWQRTKKNEIQRKKRAEYRYKSLLSSMFAFIQEDECLWTTSSGSASLLHLYRRSFPSGCA